VNASQAVRETRHAIAVAWRQSAIAGLAALAGLVSLAIMADGRADLAARTNALHAMVDEAPVTDRVITASSDYFGFIQSAGTTDPAALGEMTGRIRQSLVDDSLPLSGASDDWADFEAPERPITAPPSAATPGLDPARMRLVYRASYPAHARLVAGRWPTSATQPQGTALEADLAAPTAARLGLRVGSHLTVQSADNSSTVELVVVGLVVPRDPSAPFWQIDQALGAPEQGVDRGGEKYWATTALIGSSQAAALVAPPADSPYALPPALSNYRLSWGFPLDISKVGADGAAPLADRLDTLFGVESALAYGPSGSPPVQLESLLTPTLRDFVAAQNTAALEKAMPMYGLALIAAIAGALLAYAAVDRRRAEAQVLRARGAATRHLVLQTLLESALTAPPAVAAATALGLLVPGRTPPWVWPAVLVCGGFALLGPTLFVALIYRPRRTVRALPVAGRSARFARHRRLILHGALAAVCIAGIELVHGQGLTPGGAVDPFAAAAPVLAAGLAALVTVNVLPLALRALRRQALPRRGVVALLGVARSAREPGTAQASTFVLTTAACTADLAVALSRLADRTAPGPLAHAAAVTLGALAALAIVAAGAVAVLAVRLGAAARAASDERLATMGLTTGQARAIAAAENAPPALAGALIGALVTVPLLRIVAPALGVAAVPVSAWMLILPALAVALPATAAGVAGTWRKGTP
jgi:hypothetical protein